MAYQSLYRRYRSQRFGDLRGQHHVVTALRNAVKEARVGHAYLFSGPRGTGKTSTARILAKALNCAQLVDGEPCLECASCVAIEAGSSFDLHELDAASNNKVDDIRDLIEHVAFSTPGRTKVYILDEVHMLTAAASAALLKTLEEPPAGVVFVLATTDPQKVIPTIRSRTQHFEFHLLPADELEEHVRWVVADAGLDVDDNGIEYALRIGGGSARDTLSALDQVAAARGVAEQLVTIDGLLDALLDRDTGRALAGVAEAISVGRDPKMLATALLNRLRDVFLAAMGASLDHVPERERVVVTDAAERTSRPFLTRSMEVLGEALVDMRESPDARITLEVALVRLTNVEADTSIGALLERVERLERALHRAGPTADTGASPVERELQGSVEALADPGPASAARRVLAEKTERASRASSPEDRRTLGAVRSAPSESSPPPSQPPPVQPQPPNTPTATATMEPTGDLPTRDELTLAWGDRILPSLKGAAKARYAAGRFVTIDGGAAVFALPNPMHCKRCAEVRDEVEAALASHFGRPVPLSLVVDTESSAVAPTTSAEPAPPDDVDVTELVDAPQAEVETGIDRLAEAFPGARLIDDPRL